MPPRPPEALPPQALRRTPRRRVGAVPALVTALVGAAGCAAVGPLAERVDQSGRHLVLLVDVSTSMRQNDPDDAARSGVDLALALAGARDNVSVVTFAVDAEVRVPLQPAGDTAAREAQRRALDGVERNGVGDVARGLVRAREVLEAGAAPRGSTVVLLTDGVPYRQARGRRLAGEVTVEEAVGAIAAKGWRVVAIALGQEAATPFLADLVARTGGSVAPAREAGDLVRAFEAVAVEALGYLRAERGTPQATVVPGTRRVAFLGHFAGAGAVAAVARDGQPVAEARLVKTTAGTFAVALAEGPEPGVWTAELPGAKSAVTLVEPGFAVELQDGAPPRAVDAGAPVPIVARLVGDADVLQAVKGKLRWRARIELDWAHATPWVELRADDAGAQGSLEAPKVMAEAPLVAAVEATLEEGGRPLVLRRTRALTVRPGASAPAPAGAPLELEVGPQTFARAAWSDEALEPVTVKVRGDPKRAVTVRAGGRELQLGAGQRGELEVACPADGRLLVEASAEGAPPWRLTLRGEVKRLKLVAAPIQLGATPAGVPARPRPLDVKVEPAAPLAFGDLVLTGPARARLPVERDEQGALMARPPADAPPGRYAGTLEVRLQEDPDGLGSRSVPVTLEVLPPPKAPATVVIKGDWGWASRPVEVAWPGEDEVAVTITPSALVDEARGARLDPRFDVRVVPLDGWSGERLGPAPRRFAVQVFLATDLPAGTYAGAVAVASADGGALTIPVRVEVAR